jgi:hypothetical protein
MKAKGTNETVGGKIIDECSHGLTSGTPSSIAQGEGKSAHKERAKLFAPAQCYTTRSKNNSEAKPQTSEEGASCKRLVTLVLVLIALCVTNTGRLEAVPSPGQHEMSGTVQRVDRETITIVPAGASKPQVFAWDKNTKFFHNGVLTSAGALRSGAQVTIRCSHPIFGKPLLYRVVWQTSSNRYGGSNHK